MMIRSSQPASRLGRSVTANGCATAESWIGGDPTWATGGGVGAGVGSRTDGPNATAAAVIVATPPVRHVRSEMSTSSPPPATAATGHFVTYARVNPLAP